MADESAAANADQDTTPSMNQVGQYIRDLSFENPGAPGSILAGAGNPNLSFNISLAYKKQADDVYSVETTLAVKAERDGGMLFNVELVYGGVFIIRNVPEAQMPQLLLVECPRQTFPFARQVVANVVQQGGFPPVLLQPVDFDAIYRQNVLMAQNEPNRTN
jgi:preprotein translocase subunit SecB